MSAFAAATQSGDLKALTQLLASDVRIVTDGGGKVAAALEVVEGADHAAQFLISVARKRPRSRLRVTSYGGCTSCAIRTSYATWRRRETRERSRMNEPMLIRVAPMRRTSDIGWDH
jgi:hypothetical protein